MSLSDKWTVGHLIDKIFENMMENGYDDQDTKKNKYIEQIVDKFKFFRLKSPSVHFDIYETDLDDETIKQKDIYLKDCKTLKEKDNKLNGLFTEVIARITEQAKPMLLADISG